MRSDSLGVKKVINNVYKSTYGDNLMVIAMGAFFVPLLGIYYIDGD